MAQGFRAMDRREEGEYSTYLTDEQRRQRAKDQARCEQNGAVEALDHVDRRWQDEGGNLRTVARPLGDGLAADRERPK